MPSPKVCACIVIRIRSVQVSSFQTTPHVDTMYGSSDSFASSAQQSGERPSQWPGQWASKPMEFGWDWWTPEMNYPDNHPQESGQPVEDKPTYTARYPENAIHYSSPYSCRQVCSMSSQTERGCVMVRSLVYILSMFYLSLWMKIEMHLENIPTTTYCNYTGDLSRTEYFK